MSAKPTHAVVSRASSTPEERISYRELFDSAPVGIYVSRPDGRLLACNAQFASILGFDSIDEALNADMTAVWESPDQGAAFLRHLQAHGRVGRIHGSLRRKDRSTVEVLSSVVGIRDASGRLGEIRGFLVDLSASARADTELQARASRFRTVFFDAADAILILSDDRRILDANRAAAAMLGISTHRLIGHALDSFVLGDADDLPAAWRELLALGETRREHRVRSEGRDPRVVECSYRAAVHTGGYLCIARDITERRSLEERLAQSEKSESIGRLAGGIAHDFNNLLTAILGYTELLLDNRVLDEATRGDLQEIQRAGQRAAALTHQLLAYSRKQVLMPKEVDLNQTVASLQGMLTRLIREDITLTCDLCPTPAVLRIDPAQLEQVILNLVLNSRDALPGGGHIRIEVARVQLAESEVPSDLPARASEYVRLRVIDSGVGIGPDVRAHLFEPFFTTKPLGKGTGLGLASVHGIVRQSNGFIGVESEPGHGATFTMHFPSVGSVPAVEGPVAGASLSTAGRETILLVEDEDAVRAIVGTVLRRQGYRVLEASSATAACDIFDGHASEIDLLVTDVVMPDLSGPALAQRLIAARPGLRILLISGYADVEKPFAADIPNVSFLSKPFQASVLATRVRAALSRCEPAMERSERHV
jgi:two-component system cell cycle sensor histidine kinase/response regulator CckA